jgi:hypothetical protein
MHGSRDFSFQRFCLSLPTLSADCAPLRPVPDIPGVWVESSTSLHCFADIVAYSGRNPYQQADCQQRLLKIIDGSLIDAGLSPGSVCGESQGDARMLTFLDGLDVSRVLAASCRAVSTTSSRYTTATSHRMPGCGCASPSRPTNSPTAELGNRPPTQMSTPGSGLARPARAMPCAYRQRRRKSVQ